jgi:hypothetical protein
MNTDRKLLQRNERDETQFTPAQLTQVYEEALRADFLSWFPRPQIKLELLSLEAPLSPRNDVTSYYVASYDASTGLTYCITVNLR